MKIDELDAVLYEAERRVLGIQTKLHRWASDDPHCRFDDLYNLVTMRQTLSALLRGLVERPVW